MRLFTPGKDSFKWLVIVAGFAVTVAFASFTWRSATDAPEATAAVVLAAPEVPLSSPTITVVKPETYATLSARFGPVAPPAVDPPPIPAAMAAIAKEPVAAPNPSRCAKYNYLVARPKRESLLDDMESKYQAAFERQRNQSFAYHQCLRKVAPNNGG